MPTPPYTALVSVDAALRDGGFAVLAPRDLAQWVGTTLDALDRWRRQWDRLPPDAHLRDGGRYRRRRHACFVVDGADVERAPDRPHWQPVEYNALHGGIERTFDPMPSEWTGEPLWTKLLATLGACSSRLFGPATWFVEAHPFRIDTTDGIGRPTPEGAHRDGVDLVAVILVDRHAIRGGETRVFDASSPHGLRFTMTEPWTTLLLDDARMIHETTPIQPDGAAEGHRDTLVLTCRRGGFQGPAR